jgi:hypothetical protein
MLADVPQMTWFANIKLLPCRFVDKMDGIYLAFGGTLILGVGLLALRIGSLRSPAEE